MDIPCPRCGEPWDIAELHYYAKNEGITYEQAQREFQKRGCYAMGAGASCEPVEDNRTAAAAVLYELMGDDLDGVAAMMEDAEMLGLF